MGEMTVTARSLIAFLAGTGVALLAGWVAFPQFLYERSQQPLQFSHKVHAEAGSSCKDCHALGEDGRFAGIPGVAKCAECHSVPLGTTPAEKKLVDVHVANNREIPWRVYSRQPDNVWLPHAVNLNRAKLACEECHADHGNTGALRPYERNRISGYSRDIWGVSLARTTAPKHQRPGMKMSDCEDCHAAKRVSAGCLACHK